MNRGEIWWVAFSGSVGGEIQKERPAIVISNDASNQRLNRIQVVPVTSQTRTVHAGETIVAVAGKEAKALAHQLATVSKLRVSNQLGALSRADLARVELAIKRQLGLG